MLCLPKKLATDAEEVDLPVLRDLTLETEAIRKFKKMIIFENEHVVVISKDHGVPSQMGTGLSNKKSSDLSVDTMASLYCSSNNRERNVR